MVLSEPCISLRLHLFFFFCHAACKMFPDQGSNSCPLQWKGRVLTTGPPGKCLQVCAFAVLFPLPIQWTWVWVNSGSWWWTGRLGVLWFMGSQRVGHDWSTELNWTEYTCVCIIYIYIYIYIHTHIYIYICTCEHMCVYIYIFFFFV